MAWITTGEVALTNNSTAVVGTGTTWLNLVGEGDTFIGPDDKLYEIASVNSGLSITLRTPYAGATIASTPYRIFPTHAYNLKVAKSANDLVSTVQSTISGFQTTLDGISGTIASIQANTALSGGFPGGSAAAPGVTVGTGTGFYTPSSNNLGVVTAGTEKVRVTSAGTVGVGTQTPNRRVEIADTTRAFVRLTATDTAGTDQQSGVEFNTYDGTGNTAGSYISSFSSTHPTVPNTLNIAVTRANSSIRFIGSAEHIRMTYGGQILAGITSARTINGVLPRIQVEGGSAATSNISVVRVSDNINPPEIILGKARGALGGVGAITSGDILGRITAYGGEGTNFYQAGYAEFTSEGTIGMNSIPTKYSITLTNNSGVRTQRMVLNADGFLGLSVPNPTARIHAQGGIRVYNTATPFEWYDNSDAIPLLRIASYTSASNPEISALIPGTTNGIVFKGQPNSQMAFTIDGNDNGDSFNILAHTATTGTATDKPMDKNVFRVTRDSRMILPVGAKIGVGTEAPNAQFQITGTSSTNEARAILTDGPSDPNFKLWVENGAGTTVSSEQARIGLKYSTTTQNTGVHFYRGGTTTGGFLKFSTNNGTENFVMDANARLGVNYDAPAYQVDSRAGAWVANSAPNGYAIRLTTTNNPSTGTGLLGGLFMETDAGGTGSVSIYSPLASTPGAMTTQKAVEVRGAGTSQELRLHTGGTFSAVLTSTGRLGVGHLTPTTVLHGRVAGNTSATGLTLDNDTDSGSGRIQYIGYGFSTTNRQGTLEIGTLSGNGITFYPGNFVYAGRFHSSGQLLLGSANHAPVTYNISSSAQTPQCQVATTTVGGYSSVRYVNSLTSATAISMAKSKGGSVGTRGAVTNQDHLGYLTWSGDDGTNFQEAARIQSRISANGTVSTTSMPGILELATTPDGSVTPSTRVTVDSTGKMGVGVVPASTAGILSVSNGITFPATQSAVADANTLDDYEEGTFTPTIIGLTTSGAGTYSLNTGRYTKVGNKVFFTLSITTTAHTGTGNIQINGLPFASMNVTSLRWACDIVAENLTYTGSLVAYIQHAVSSITISSQASGAAFAGIAMDSTVSITVTGTYQV